MDTGEGRFKLLATEEHEELLLQNSGRTDIFTVNEIVNIRDSLFKITKITPKKMILRVLPKKRKEV